MMITSIYLCNIPELNIEYSHTFDFVSLSSQSTYFRSKVVKTYTNCYYQRGNNKIRLECHIDDILNCNYLYYINKGKVYYCFILDKYYISDRITEFSIEIDVMQTFLFDYSLRDSFVDRCHVDRWDGENPTIEIENENLEIGEHIEIDREMLYNYSGANMYVITTNVPIGVVDDPFRHFGSNSGGITNNNGDWENGEISANGFAFLKGWEGFGKMAYNDGFGFYTIAYGVTSHGCPTEYKELVQKQPLNEETGAKVSFNVSKNNYGLKIVERCKQLGITKQCQFDALIDLGYNCGISVILNDNSITNAIKTGDSTAIKNAWTNFYITANGVTVDSLRQRRKQEVDIFLNANYVYRPIGIYDQNRKQVGIVVENDGKGWLPGNINTDNVVIGTGEVTNIYGKGTKPTTGTITAYYPYYPSGGRHTGVDIANVEGTPIYAWRGGKILSVGAGYGIGIFVEHDDNKSMAIYGHCSKSLVNAGDTVKQGQKIGLMGSTGNSTGNHLHFEIRPKGGAYGTDVNPWEGIKVGDKV